MSEQIEISDELQEKEPSSIKLVLALAIAGLLSGFVLVGSYIYTLPIIQENKATMLKEAIFKVLESCDTYKTLVVNNDKLVFLDEDDEDNKSEKIYLGYNKDKQPIGFAIPGAEPGFQDIIGVIYGYNSVSSSIIGFEVLESKETPGLGDKIFKDAAFQENFVKLQVMPNIISVKNGTKMKENEVEAITGATISSKAVVRLLNKSISIWKDKIDVFINENNIELSNE